MSTSISTVNENCHSTDSANKGLMLLEKDTSSSLLVEMGAEHSCKVVKTDTPRASYGRPLVLTRLSLSRGAWGTPF